MTLSVALCTYNGEKYIIEQLTSIANQILQVNEIVICDDKSQDNTIDCILDFMSKHPNINIKLYQNDEQLWVVKNFEKAMSLCSGDIIFLCDQDDIWEINKTKKIIDYFSLNQNVNLVFTNAELINQFGENISDFKLFDAVGLYKNILKLWNKGLDFEILASGNRVTGATVAFRKTMVSKVSPFIEDKVYIHDMQLALHAINDNAIGIIDEPLIKYRIHGNNVCGLNENFYNGKNKISLLYTLSSHNLPFVFEEIINNPIIVRRIDFYKKRYENIKTIKGKIKIICNFFLYKKYYANFFLYVIWIDLISNGRNILRKLFNIQ